MKIGQKSQHPIREYNMDHISYIIFFDYHMDHISYIIFFCVSNRGQIFNKKNGKMNTNQDLLLNIYKITEMYNVIT